jgi:signal transduction histidine kinase
MTTLQKQPFVVDELLSEVASMLEGQASEKDLPVTVEPSSASIDVRGDVRLIKMALFNYLSNAIRFTEQGEVILRARVLEATDLAALVRFEVQDTGIGIGPEDIGRLFSAFEQVDNSATRKFGGLGVGLSISKKIAARLGGDVGCDSNVGQGSNFWLSVRLKRLGHHAG